MSQDDDEKATPPEDGSTMLMNKNEISTTLQALYKDFRKQNTDSCDVEIIINGNKHIYTHRLVLFAHSEFLKKKMGTEKIMTIDDPDVNIKTMKILLRYLYKGALKTDSKKYFIRVKQLARKLKIVDLYNIMSKYQKDSSEKFELKQETSKQRSRKSRRSRKSQLSEAKSVRRVRKTIATSPERRTVAKKNTAKSLRDDVSTKARRRQKGSMREKEGSEDNVEREIISSKEKQKQRRSRSKEKDDKDYVEEEGSFNEDKQKQRRTRRRKKENDEDYVEEEEDLFLNEKQKKRRSKGETSKSLKAKDAASKKGRRKTVKPLDSEYKIYFSDDDSSGNKDVITKRNRKQMSKRDLC
uniref:BTB domain-containing protein n=1 Tax=Parastrongyloides trichosuri TaxID=131310 RepID=A0A0N4Z0K2_PARTI